MGDRRTEVIEAAEAELTRAVEGLAEDTSDEARSRVVELLDLQDLLGIPVGFDIQTAFYRSWVATGSSAELTELAGRLGFATGPDVV